MKSRRIWRTGLIALGILAGAWAFAALLLPVLWPFRIGLAVSLLAEKPVRLLQTRARFPRWLAAGVCVLTLFVLLFGGAFFLCRLLCTEAADQARQRPQLAEWLAPPVLRLKDRLLSLAEKLPDGWHTNIGENGCELSGGERQRISIARAFLKNAPIILLDEATASLDVENETLIQTALSRLIADKTVQVNAHRMRTVAGADKIVVLSDGTVAEEGSPKNLEEKNGVYAHMVKLQTESQNWKLA